MSEAIHMRLSPDAQVKEAIVAYLRGVCGTFSNPIPVEQIRGLLDVSGTPKDAYGIVVGCDNLGEHWGANNRGILIDVKPRIVVFTHINDDSDGSLCDALVSDVMEAMRRIEYSLDGWHVAWGGNWSVGEGVMQESFRQSELSATMPLVRQFDLGF